MRLLRCLNGSIEADSVPCFSPPADMNSPSFCISLKCTLRVWRGWAILCLSATKTHPQVSCVGVAPGALICLERDSLPHRGDRVCRSQCLRGLSSSAWSWEAGSQIHEDVSHHHLCMRSGIAYLLLGSYGTGHKCCTFPSFPERAQKQG